jgi:chemotaxis protein MotB
MKKINSFSAIGISIFLLLSCVSTKKYKSLEAENKKANSNEKICSDELRKTQADVTVLNSKNASLQSQVEDLKKNSNQVLNALQDMSVLSSKQEESIKESFATMSKKDGYIMNLQSAIARKDSLNLALVMNLKSSLSDINDKDINIKVEKGVVYVDLSDKLLFNSGQYKVTEKAKNILGKIASILNAHQELDVMVEGHTDNTPIHNSMLDDNWDLSVKRSTSVVRILEKEYKINPLRITAAGHGEYVPVASNDTPEGKALNRRTRIIILPQLDQFFKLMVQKP